MKTNQTNKNINDLIELKTQLEDMLNKYSINDTNYVNCLNNGIFTIHPNTIATDILKKQIKLYDDVIEQLTLTNPEPKDCVKLINLTNNDIYIAGEIIPSNKKLINEITFTNLGKNDPDELRGKYKFTPNYDYMLVGLPEVKVNVYYIVPPEWFIIENRPDFCILDTFSNLVIRDGVTNKVIGVPGVIYK